MKTELTILTWNINQWPVVGRRRRCRRGLARVRPMIRAFDVVCLQECWSGRSQALRGAFPHHHLDGERAFTGFGTGLLTLSKHPVVEVRSRRYRERRFPDSLAAKGVSLARVRVPDFGEIDIVNTHLQRWMGRTVRRAQVLELERFIRKTSKNTVAILAGDLNLGRRAWGYRHLLGSLPVRDLLRESPVRVSLENGVRFSGADDRIDHLFLLLWGDADVELLETGYVRQPAEEGRYPSDHHGLYARIQLGKGTP